ncbi:MAG: sigma-54 dependent transcriptional regulator [Bdellovibrionales bacterium]|nr:sigma-54 dependent transcriptional regulator [Bdellovibrionales bacterium]
MVPSLLNSIDMKPRILAVDDDILVLSAFKNAMNGSDIQLDVATNSEECLKLVRQHPLRYAVVFLDHNLSEGSGNGDVVAKRLKEINPEISVIMVSGDYSQEALNAWLEAGVDHFLYKPFQAHLLRTIAENECAKFESSYISASEIPSKLSIVHSKSLRKVGLISASPSLGHAAQLAELYASNQFNVLILGETGTGKEILAKAIHKLSQNSSGQFLAINCSSYTNNESLLESELFGHEKGSFTGAEKQKIGVFEAANGGVVFLDEVHHLGPNAQKKLLRVIQERKVRRVGGNIEMPVRFRLIAAGKPDLKEMTRSGTFTPDLYYRIKELLLDVPALRERRQDIKPLFQHFKAIYEHALNKKIETTEAALNLLEQYNWPGNVRELENLVKSLLVVTDGPAIRVSDLPSEFRNQETGEFLKNGNLVQFNLLVAEQELQQRHLLLTALKQTQNNVSKAAVILGIARSTMRDLLKKFRIEESLANSKAGGIDSGKN